MSIATSDVTGASALTESPERPLSGKLVVVYGLRVRYR